MKKVITEKKHVDEVITRGVEKIYPDEKSFKGLLMSKKRIRLYCGFDPSAKSLHIGNAILINKLSQFQELGHEVIFLIGDFTGMIGDPTDKSSARKKLTRKEVLKNSENYKNQASAYLDFKGSNPVQVKYNSEWSDKMSFKDLIEVSSNFTVQQMIQRDMFQERLKEEKPIYLHEFLYPLAQGYDSVAMDVDLEIGGNDQMFNMMAGRDLMKVMGKRNKFVMTLKLLADDSGSKMGKSEGNAVFLDEKAENMYGIIMSWPDGVIAVAFELCTKISSKDLEEIKNKLSDKKNNPRDLKMRLAYEITKLVHGDKKAKEAQEYFIRTVQKKEVPEEIKNYELKIKKWNIVDLFLGVGLVASKGEARRLIKQNGIKVDGKVVSDVDMELKLDSEGVLLQRGKRGFVRAMMK